MQLDTKLLVTPTFEKLPMSKFESQVHDITHTTYEDLLNIDLNLLDDADVLANKIIDSNEGLSDRSECLSDKTYCSDREINTIRRHSDDIGYSDVEDSDPDLVIEDSNSSNDEEFAFSKPIVQAPKRLSPNHNKKNQFINQLNTVETPIRIKEEKDLEKTQCSSYTSSKSPDFQKSRKRKTSNTFAASVNTLFENPDTYLNIPKCTFTKSSTSFTKITNNFTESPTTFTTFSSTFANRPIALASNSSKFDKSSSTITKTSILASENVNVLPQEEYSEPKKKTQAPKEQKKSNTKNRVVVKTEVLSSDDSDSSQGPSSKKSKKPLSPMELVGIDDDALEEEPYISKEEFERLEKIRRERNRLAARRCRQKQKDRIDRLEKTVNAITHDNDRIENEIDLLRREMQHLADVLNNHRCAMKR